MDKHRQRWSWRKVKQALRTPAALLWRRAFRKTTFVGITGSCGKTTTTDLLSEILGAAPTRELTQGNNNPSATARMLLLSRPWRDRHLIFEVSGHHPGAVEPFIRLIRPDVAIVTTIGSDHRKSFKSLEATAAEKSILVTSVDPAGFVVLNLDDPRVAGMSQVSRARVVTIGRAEGADLRLISAETHWPPRLRLQVRWRGEEFTVESPVVGDHWSVAILAALATALELGVDRAMALKTISEFRAGYNRMSFHQVPDGRYFVLDAFKAPHWGLPACLGFLERSVAPRKTVVFGDISDSYGRVHTRYEEAAKWARSVADRVIFTGPESARVRRLRESELSNRIFEVPSIEAANELLGSNRMENEIIYLKGSGADHLERLLHAAFSPILCWEDRCGESRCCIHCTRLLGRRLRDRHGFSQLPWLDRKDSRPV
ncbi:MAG: Mur ligase family protein [Verrucomicrobiales bacterium]